MPDLEAKYRAAQAKFAKTGRDEDKDAFKAAKQAFVNARQEQKQAEEADPDHPRSEAGHTVGITRGTIASEANGLVSTTTVAPVEEG